MTVGLRGFLPYGGVTRLPAGGAGGLRRLPVLGGRREAPPDFRAGAASRPPRRSGTVPARGPAAVPERACWGPPEPADGEEQPHGQRPPRVTGPTTAAPPPVRLAYDGTMGADP
ncbi:hypothetical protein GCM10010393_06970 [Streptomyces gobitricini]|uniref:Uncharacterized protein n=1 Tax=Streptomyces gobitricini TaxID=68211 RepID=A0ABN3LAA8_9ACTN